MSVQLLPLQAVPDQTLQAYLGGQNITLRVYQRRYGLFVDLYKDNALVREGMEGLNLVKLVRDGYLGVTGNLYFHDTQGNQDPHYEGLGGRYVLLYDASL